METNIDETKINSSLSTNSELSSNRAVLKSLKKKILELNCLKTNITNIIIYNTCCNYYNVYNNL